MTGEIPAGLREPAHLAADGNGSQAGQGDGLGVGSPQHERRVRVWLEVSVAQVPGCVATGGTREEVIRNMREAIEMHVQGLLEDSASLPDSAASAEYIAVAV